MILPGGYDTMNYRLLSARFILSILISLMLGSTDVHAQQSSGAASPPPSATQSATSSGERLTELEQEVEKLKKPQKDLWDKLSAISGLISGSLVVLLGFFVTYLLNERNRISSDQQKQRELAVSQVQTVQGFMPQLQSGGPREVEAALLAIFALDTNSRLATDLASLYRNEGSISALRKIAIGPDAESAKRAQQTLANMFTVSLKRFSSEREDLNLSIDSLRTFYDLTSQVFWGLKGAVEPFTYEDSWILRDKATGKEIRKERTESGDIVRIDLRSLGDVGIEPGMTLEAIRIESGHDDPAAQSQK